MRHKKSLVGEGKKSSTMGVVMNEKNMLLTLTPMILLHVVLKLEKGMMGERGRESKGRRGKCFCFSDFDSSGKMKNE
jgi:hypothetical protein